MSAAFKALSVPVPNATGESSWLNASEDEAGAAAATARNSFHGKVGIFDEIS